jgi:hypothetical protein
MTQVDAYSQIFDMSGGTPAAYSRPALIRNTTLKPNAAAALTLDTTMNGSTLLLNNASPIAVTIPKGLHPNFVCSVIQIGAGQVGFAPGTGVTLNSFSNYRHISGQWAAATLQAIGQDNYVLAGTLVL